MQASVIAIAAVIAIAGLAAPALVPALEDVAPVQEAEAAKCVIGPGCIVPVYCVRDCDYPPRE